MARSCRTNHASLPLVPRYTVAGIWNLLYPRDLKMLKHNSHHQRDVYVEERAWSKAFEHLAVSVAQLTLDGRLLSANKQMCEAIGRAERDLLGKSLSEFFLPEETWPQCRQGLDRLVAGG